MNTGTGTGTGADVVVVGGGPAGIITAATTKSVYPDKRVKLIKDVGDGVIPCAIPYMMRTLAAPEQNAMSTAALEDKGIEVVVDRVTALLPDDNAIELESGGRVGYERLVLATGSTPVAPPIPGIGTPGVFVIDKSLSAMTVLRERVAQAKRVAILGGGFIGAEFADELGRGLWGEAWLLLETVAETHDAPAAHLWTGDVLSAIKLPDEAEAAYQAALERAEALGDLESQAAAQAGLWYVTGDEVHWEKAVELYERLGDEAAQQALEEER